MDVILVAPMEKNVSSRNVFRETAIREDKKNLELNPLLSGFINRYRENLGLACLAAYLRRFHYIVQIINANIENKSNDQIVAGILRDRPYLVGFSVLYELHLYNTLDLIFQLRRKGYCGHISIGGPAASFLYEFLLKTGLGIDSVMAGEGELSISQLIACLKDGRDWSGIEGIAYEKDGQVIYNEKKGLPVDLSELPFAARDSLIYLKQQGYKTRTASIYSSRGCGGNCVYCTAPATSRLEPKKWRCRSGASLYEEVEYLVKEFGIEYLYFCDVNFIGYGQAARERLEVFSKKIIENKLKINFHAEIRVDSLKPDLLELLQRAGMRDVLLGIESGSQRLLNSWKKGVRVEQNKKGIKRIKEQGFLLEPAMIMVSPLTNKQDLIETIDFIIETEIYEDNIPMNMFNKMCLFRGSEAERIIREQGLLSPPDMDVITRPILEQKDIVTLCRELLSRDYQIVDAAVQKAWETVIPYINKLTWLIQEYFPDYLSSSFQSVRGGMQGDKKELLKTISSVKLWRSQLKLLIKEILLTIKNYLLEDNERMADSLDKELSGLVRSYEEKYLGYPLDHLSAPFKV